MPESIRLLAERVGATSFRQNEPKERSGDGKPDLLKQTLGKLLGVGPICKMGDRECRDLLKRTQTAMRHSLHAI